MAGQSSVKDMDIENYLERFRETAIFFVESDSDKNSNDSSDDSQNNYILC